MKRILRNVGIGLAVLVVLFVVLSLWYYLPSTLKAHVTGTEVKRIDVASAEGDTKTRDVRFIVTQQLGTERTFVFRNEDTGWGWPPYFKFNSGDLMGQAVNLHESPERNVVLVTYYGWRMTFLDLYPNVLSLKRVSADYRHIPVFNIVVVALLLGLVGFVYFRVRRFRKRRERKRADA